MRKTAIHKIAHNADDRDLLALRAEVRIVAPSRLGHGAYEGRPVPARTAETCAIRGCDRLQSGAPDHDGDLCGDHRAAEVALGRGPVST